MFIIPGIPFCELSFTFSDLLKQLFFAARLVTLKKVMSLVLVVLKGVVTEVSVSANEISVRIVVSPVVVVVQLHTRSFLQDTNIKHDINVKVSTFFITNKFTMLN